MRLWLLVAVVLGCAFGALALPREARAENLVNWSYDESSKTLTIGGDEGSGTTGTIDVDEQYDSEINIPWYSYRDAIKSVEFDKTDGDPVSPTNMRNWFNGCTNLASVNFQDLDTSLVKDLANTFRKCSSLTSLDLSSWNVSNVVDMGNLFNGCSSLTSLDVSSWDTSKVTSLNQTFSGCKALANLEISSWDTAKVTSIYWAFKNCGNLEYLDLSNWDVSKVEKADSAFQNCSKLQVLRLDSWQLDGLTDNGDSMFDGCTSLQTIICARTWASQGKYEFFAYDAAARPAKLQSFSSGRGFSEKDSEDWNTNFCSPETGYFDSGGIESGFTISKVITGATGDLNAHEDAFKFDIEPVGESDLYLYAAPMTLSGGNAPNEALTSEVSIVVQDAIENSESFIFKVTERRPTVPEYRYKYDTKAYYLKVTVNKDVAFPSSSNGYDGLSAGDFTVEAFSDEACESPLGTLQFTNTYQEPTYAPFTFTGEKLVLDEDGESAVPPSSNTYRFLVVADAGSPMPSSEALNAVDAEMVDARSFECKNDGRDIRFPEITCDEPGPFTYTISEVKTDPDSYMDIRYRATVTENHASFVDGKLQLEASIRYEGTAVGAGTLLVSTALFPACKPVSFTFTGEKLVLGGNGESAVPPSSNTYRFLVVANEGSPMPSEKQLGAVGAEKASVNSFICKNDGRDIRFPEITCDGPGPFTYTISEVKTDPDNYMDIRYRATVTEDHASFVDGKFQLKASIRYEDTAVGAGTLKVSTALFPACKPDSFTMHGKKGGAGTSTATYRVSALEDNTTLPSSASGHEYTCSTKADGSIDYQPIEDLSPGQYTYGVREVPDPDNLLGYDDTSYVVTVTVAARKVGEVYETSVERVTYASDRLVPDENGYETYEVASETSDNFNKTDGTLFKAGTQAKLYQAAVESGVPRHDWTGGVINKSVQYWCAAPVGKKVTIEVPAEFTVTNLSEGAKLVEGSEGKPRTITWTSSADKTQISWYATPTGVSDIKVVKTTAKVGDEVVDSLQYAIYHVNGSVADEYQASITEHTKSEVTTYEETEVRREEDPAAAGDQANWRSAGDAYRNAAGSEVTTSYMSDCARWSESGDSYDAAERITAHLEVQGATVEEPVLIPAYVFTVCTAHNFSRSICEKDINDLLTDYGICVIKGADWRGVARDSLVAYRSTEGNNDAEWKAYLDGLGFDSDEHFTNVLPIAIKEVLFDSFAARSERASLVHDVCALYTSFDCSPTYSMVGNRHAAWGDFNTWIVANDPFWAYLADRYVADETYFSMSELGYSKNGTFSLSVSQSDWDVWYSAPAFKHEGYSDYMFLQADEVGRAALMDPMNYVNAHQSRQGGTFSALYPYNRSFDECNIEPVEGTLAMEAVVRDGFTVTHIQAKHDGFVVEADVTGDPASGYELTPTGNGTLRGANTKTIEAASEAGEVKLRLVLDGQKATVYALGHESEDPENIRLNIDANVDHAKVPEGTWFDTYAGNPRLAWSGQQIIDIKPPILGLAGPDLELEKVQVGEDATSASDHVGWTKDTLQLTPSGTLSYSFKLKNSGKVAATDVYIEDYLPKGLTLSDATIEAINAQKAKGKESFWFQEERHFKYYVADTIAAATEVDGELTPTELDLTTGEHPFIVVTTLPGTKNAVYANSATATARELPDPVESNTVIATTGSHVEWTPFAEKTMETGVLQEGQFSFRLWTEGESVEALAPMPLGATTTTNGEGKAASEITVRNGAPAEGKGRVDFGTIVFTKADTYTYYLQEVVPASATADEPVNGVTYDTAVYRVEVQVAPDGGDGGYKIDSIDVSKVVALEAAGSPTRKSEAESLATFTNSATGSLEISKQVVGTESQQKQDFTFAIQLDDKSFSGTLSEVKFTGGEATVTLHHGQSKLIEGLPAGMGYKVTETAADGFNTTSTGSVGSIPVGGTAKAAFTNIAKGALTITKVVKGTTDSGDLTTKFIFTITLSKIPGSSGFTAGTYGGLTFSDSGDGTYTATCELANGDSATATGLPEGAHYKVEEANAEGYASNLANAEGTIPATGFVSVQATNTKEAGNLVVYKTVPTLDVSGLEPATKEFTITVTLDQADFSGEYGDFTFVNGKASVTLASGEQKVARGLPAGIGYTVTEAAADGYTTEYRGETGEISAGATEQATVTNNITTGSLRVSKTVVPGGDALTEDELAQQFSFTVTLYKPAADETEGEVAADINGSYPGTYPGSGGVKFEGGVATFSLKHGESVTINQLPPGYLYTVTEDGASGYTTASTGSEGQIPANGTATASFVNTHGEAATASLVVRKTVTGTVAPGTKFKFTVTLTKDGSPLTGTYGGYVFDESGQAELELQGGEEAVITGIPAESHYTVTETSNESAGDYTITSSNNEGDLTAGAVVEAAFTNNFITTGSLTISKKLEGENIDVDKDKLWIFTITLTKADSSPLSGTFGDVVFDASGKATVQLKGGESREIKGIPAGTRYTVEEQKANEAPYSTTSVGAEGTIQTGEAAEAAFTNTKAEARLTPALVDIKKTVISAGNAESIKGHVFSFLVTPDSGNPAGDPLEGKSRTVTTPGEASGNTETIELFDHEFSQAGTYRYTVSEVTGADPAISYDHRTFTVEVEISRGGYDAEHNLYPLLAKATIKDATGAILAEGGDGTSKATLEVEFKNTYNVNEITVPLKAHKTLEGKELKAGDFAFELTAAEGTPLPEGATTPIKASNDASGYVQFGSVTFHAAGTFTYTIREVIPVEGEKASGVTYDEGTWQATVVVKDNGSAGLSAEVTYAKVVEPPAAEHPEANSNAAEFVNSYEPPTPPPPPSEGAPALKVSKTHGLNDDLFEHSHTLVNEVTGGDVVTYFVKVENTGDAKATDVTVRDVVPEGLELVGNSVSEGGSVGSDDRTIIWSLGTLGVGESRVVSFGVRVPAVDVETTWTNVASAWADEVPDPKATNVVMEHAAPPENPPDGPDEPSEPDNPPDTPPDSPPDSPGTPGTPGQPDSPSQRPEPEPNALPKTGDGNPLSLAACLAGAGAALLAAAIVLALRARRA